MKWHWECEGKNECQLGNGHLNCCLDGGCDDFSFHQYCRWRPRCGRIHQEVTVKFTHHLPKEQVTYTSRRVPTGQRPFSGGCEDDVESPPELRSPTEYRNRRRNIYSKKTEILNTDILLNWQSQISCYQQKLEFES